MIKPEELQVQHNETAQRLAKELEVHIDKRLREKYEGLEKKIIIEVPEGFKRFIVNYALCEYIKNGWDAIYVDNPTSGDHLVFTHKKPTVYSSDWKD